MKLPLKAIAEDADGQWKTINVQTRTVMDTDQEKETKYVYAVSIQCDHVMNTIAGAFTEHKSAKEFESYLRRIMFGSGTSHPNAVFTHIVPFNPEIQE